MDQGTAPFPITRTNLETLVEACRDGVIPHTRIPGRNGHEYRFDRDDVLAYFARRTRQDHAGPSMVAGRRRSALTAGSSDWPLASNTGGEGQLPLGERHRPAWISKNLP
jgi:hypothetical protein